jgi:Icc-related predicted phosphoesterase
VPDTPFGLKDWSKRDYAGWVSPPQLSDYAVVSESAKTKVPFHKDPYRYKILKDPVKFLKNRTTIQQDLKTIDGVDILFAHCPPADLSLDVCYGGDRPGSRAILEWIDRMRPAVTLHGHIHESYQVTGIWRVTRGTTEVIQPGHRNFVVVDIERNEVTGKCEVHTKLVPY